MNDDESEREALPSGDALKGDFDLQSSHLITNHVKDLWLDLEAHLGSIRPKRHCVKNTKHTA